MAGKKGSKKSKGLVIFLAAVILLLTFFAVITIKIADKTFEDAKATETFTEVDYYSMQKYCSDNSSAVMSALKSGKKEKLEELMTDASGIDDVLSFADWSKADFKNSSSFGQGSLSASPDESGLMDMSERFFVDIEDIRYVLYIETLTSRWGRTNEGVSAVAVTTFDYFDSVDYAWNGDKVEQSVLAGKPFWRNEAK